MHKSKYLAYTYLSIKTLLLNKSILFGFLFNLLIALIVAIYLIIFQPELSLLNDGIISYHSSNALRVLNIIIIILVTFLFSSVAAIMQSVIDDRDSKVTEIINTSIMEKHYLFGKVVTAFVLTVLFMMSAFLAVMIAGIVFSIFNPYDFSVFSDIIKPVFAIIDGGTLLFLIGCFGICMLMLITSILFTLSISIKANSLMDAFPVSLLVFSPYFLVFGLLIFLPSANSELWMTIAAVASFLPIFSPIFILIYVLLDGFTILAFSAIIISILYLFILFKATANIYSYAFYVNEKLSLKQLMKLSVKGAM